MTLNNDVFEYKKVFIIMPLKKHYDYECLSYFYAFLCVNDVIKIENSISIPISKRKKEKEKNKKQNKTKQKRERNIYLFILLYCLIFPFKKNFF